MESTRAASWRKWITLVLAVAILVPSLLGFANKFVEFLMIYRGESEGSFAVAPVLNYLLASGGFFLLLLWAALNGMFRDIERPKYVMLQRELEGVPDGYPPAADDSDSILDD